MRQRGRNKTPGSAVMPVMIKQLDPPLPLEMPKGAGLAHFIIDYGPEADLLWVVFMDKDGACWTVPNPEIRMPPNWTMGRRKELAAEAPPLTPEHAPASQNGRLHRV